MIQEKKTPEAIEPATPEGIKDALKNLASKDQVFKFKLDIHKLLAPQSGPTGLWDLARRTVVVKRTAKKRSEGIGATDRQTREEEEEHSTKNSVTLHMFPRPQDKKLRLDLGGPRGILMTHLYQACKKAADMRHLAPKLSFLNVRPDHIIIPEPVQGKALVNGQSLPVDVILEKVFKGYKEMRRQMAYEYIKDVDSVEMELYNSAVAPLSKEEWALILHSINSGNLPPAGRSSVTATLL